MLEVFSFVRYRNSMVTKCCSVLGKYLDKALKRNNLKRNIFFLLILEDFSSDSAKALSLTLVYCEDRKIRHEDQ